MITTFDGDNLIITLTAGGVAHTVDVENDLYGAWKEWFIQSANTGYPPAFRVVGGDKLLPGLDAGAYFFLRNDLGWRIRPAEEDATINFTGNLIPQNGALPIVVATVGDFTVFVNGLQPITQNVSTLLTALETAQTDLNVARKLLQNRRYTNPVTGVLEVYDDTDTFVEFSANLYADDGVLAWDGTNLLLRQDRIV